MEPSESVAPSQEHVARLGARVEPGGVTVSAEDQQGVCHWVFCDRPLPGGARCALPTDHLSPCARRCGRASDP
ncbi:hypothetical protein ACGFNF_17225 [Micromonospora sp. NPDC048868]|uniref:hypothetical protein n=1 Tax=Micromonospora sp. NPDC048868 TaxID=3364258 RepID=UPI00371248B3